MASKVFVHVGAPLAPSTSVRDGLARHRRRLARLGMLYPPGHLGHDGGHREAVLDVLGLTAADGAPVAGAWDRLAATVRDWRRGTAVLSHELLAEATESQVDRIVSSLGDAEVHVVHVAQDLGRQLPRAWQWWVHGGGTVPFATYAARILRREQHRTARVFWRSHDLDQVLSRWATRVPGEHVHVVTAARGDDGDAVTWERFARTLGIDPLRFRHTTSGCAPLASLAGTEVVRLLNASERPLDPLRLQAVVRHSAGVAGVVPRLPSSLREPADAEADRATRSVVSNGWHLVGDLDDLAPREDAFTTGDDGATPSAQDVVRAQTEVLESLCTPSRARRGPAGMRRRALQVLQERVRS